MLQKIRDFDLKLSDLVETGYFWLYDRTGVCVAPLTMISLICSYGLYRTSFNWFDYVVIGWNGVILSMRYYLQIKENFEVLNRDATNWRESTFRFWFMLPLIAPFMFFSLLAADFLYALGFCFLLLYGYLMCVRLRKRDPKAFFESKQVLAKQGI